jgi:hypothetical protein
MTEMSNAENISTDVAKLLVALKDVGLGEPNPLSKLKSLCGGWTDKELRAVVDDAHARGFVDRDVSHGSLRRVELNASGVKKAESLV